jgi:ligand-binding SRPBCC domain-containing protein
VRRSSVDTQTRGPYRSWIREHRFEEQAGGTTFHDHVRYSVLGGRIIDLLIVRRELRKIFAFREKKLAEIFT